MRLRSALAVPVLALSAAGAWAQPVYKCVDKGRTTYSHDPCLGAQVVDTTPTQGLDKSSGQSRKGADVRRSEDNKAMAEALRPLLGETPEQRETRHRRSKLPVADRLECDRLDPVLGGASSMPHAGHGASTSNEDRVLFEQRKRYRELRC